MATEIQQVESAIALLEAQRALLGDAVVETALAPLRARLAGLTAQASTGSALAPQALRTVCILFLDVVGSTALSQLLDPEETHQVMDGALVACTDIVNAHGGKVLQYAGDNLLAVFGADRSREDDNELAVHCGLALLQEGLRQGAQVLKQHGHAGFNVRVGLHTGPVLLGGGVDAEGSIRGMAVNIAARMEQTAPAGALRISHDTFRHVRGLFDVLPQDAISVKGIDTPMLTYLVQRARQRNFFTTTRGIEGIATPLVGRQAQLQVLRELLARQFAQAQPGLAADTGAARLQAITVAAEAGVGKSRLTQEFLHGLQTQDQPYRLLTGRALPATQHRPFGLLRDIVFTWLHIDDSDSTAAARHKLEQQLASFYTGADAAMAQAHAHVLGQLLGVDWSDSPHLQGILDDGKQLRGRAFHTVAHMLRQACHASLDGQPSTQVVVLVLDDLHWADEASLDCLDFCCRASRDLPLLLLGLTRPDLFETRTSWGAAAAHHTRLDLPPLDDNDSQTLAQALLQRMDDVPPELLQLLAVRAQGNPFYMEELVKMLLEEGAIVPHAPEGSDDPAAQRWRMVPGKVISHNIPATLTGVLQARLDRLPAHDKLALQEASVIGMLFWRPILEALDPVAVASLDALQQRALVIPQDGPEDEAAQARALEAIHYAFKHQILHGVTYGSVLKRAKRMYHLRAAEWLVSKLGRAGDDFGQIAHHFEQADDAPRAADFYARAAEAGLAALDLGLVLRQAERVLALAPEDQAALRWRALAARQRALRQQGRMAEQQADLDAMQALAQASGQAEWQAIVAVRQATVLRERAGAQQGLEAAEHAVAVAQQAGVAEWTLAAHSALTISCIRLGKLAQARQSAETGLHLARQAQQRRLEGEFLQHLGRIATASGDAHAGQSLVRQSMAIDSAIGHLWGVVSAHNNLGDASFRLGRYDEATHDLSEANRLARQVGLPLLEAISLINLSGVAHFTGQHAHAMQTAQQACELALRLEDRLYHGAALLYLGWSALGAGEFAQARQALGQARAGFDTLGNPPLALEAGMALAQTALAEGQPAEAATYAAPTLAHLAAGGSLEGTEHPLLMRLTCFQVLQHADRANAQAMLATAHAEMLAGAAKIGDAGDREAFLGRVPYHRDIAAAVKELLGD